MSNVQIAVIVGSLRKDSFNRKLATAIERLAPADFKFTHLRIDDLPLYNQDDDGSQAPQVVRLKKTIAARPRPWCASRARSRRPRACCS
jgi:chromate reductase